VSLILDGSNGLSDVDGSAATPAIRGTDTNTGIFFPAADTIAFSEGGTEVARFNSAGNLGVGTTNPRAQISFSNALATAGEPNKIRIYDDGSTQAYGIGLSTSQQNYVVAAGGNHCFYVGNLGSATETMRVDSLGNVLVGKTIANDTTLGFWIRNSGSAYSAGVDNYWIAYNTSAAAYRFYVSPAGTVNATSTTISAISDQRLKENIQDIDVGLDEIMALKPRKFDWKANKGKNIKGDRGWIAQEFEQVFPEMINEWLDPAPEGEEPYKSVAADLIPVLVKAVQELKAELDTVKAELATLKGAA
jgi:hypothetical protein